MLIPELDLLKTGALGVVALTVWSGTKVFLAVWGSKHPTVNASGERPTSFWVEMLQKTQQPTLEAIDRTTRAIEKQAESLVEIGRGIAVLLERTK